jgi:hypothetical protein
MRTSQQVFLWLSISLLGALTLSPASMGQAAPGSKAATPAITDWSYHHVIFSKPATAEQARRVERDPRYRQQIRRQSPGVPQSDSRTVLGPELVTRGPHGSSSSKNPGLDRDWAEDLGTGASVGAGNYPAKYSFDPTTANCTTDFVVYPTGLEGSNTQASIVAYNNLYSGCGGTVPSVYWAYYIGTGNTIQSSPVFSLDGTQLAFVQADTSGDASLVLMKWVASTTETVDLPMSLGIHGMYAACHTPCHTEFHLADKGVFSSDTNSSVFFDYDTDTAYVGDDLGYLHKFSPVFSGNPFEVTGGGWPVQVNPTNATPLTDPVYDSGSGNVFVEDEGGYLYSVDAAGTVSQSTLLDYSTLDDAGPGFTQGPVVDSTSGLLYVFAPSDGSSNCAGAACAVVYQFSTTVLLASPPKAEVGASTVNGSTPNPLYIGAFDSAYENSASPPTGHIYLCGNTGGTPTLYQVPITAGVFGTAIAGPALAETTTPCSPVTDVLNPNASEGPTEWIFASEETEGVSSACANGCIYNFNVTSWQPSTVYAVGQEVFVPNSSGGLQIEVVSSVSGAGTSSAIEPTWRASVGAATTDNDVTWLDQGVLRAPVLSGWTANHHYTIGTEIIDPNDNIELVTAVTGVGNNSGASIPAFSLTAGGTVTTLGLPPNAATFTNVGAAPSAALAASGGASGVIVDNVVGAVTESGASQIYFTTLSDQNCATSGGTGGCAVQASQSALH